VPRDFPGTSRKTHKVVGVALVSPYKGEEFGCVMEVRMENTSSGQPAVRRTREVSGTDVNIWVQEQKLPSRRKLP